MTTPLKRSFAVVSMIVALASLAGCKAQEAQPSGFIETPELMSHDPSTPFNRSYWNKKFDPKAYDELLVTPVNTQYVMAQSIWEKANVVNVSPEQVRKDIDSIAQYTRQSFVRAATDDPKRRFKVVDNPGKQTLILEVAIVQLVPSKAVLNAIGQTTWIPGSIAVRHRTLLESRDAGRGTISIEGRVRDGATGEVIGMFSDLQHPATAIIDLRALNWWAPIKPVIDRWSHELIALANRPAGSVIKDAPPFELLVW
jgi:hypothetical protein